MNPGEMLPAECKRKWSRYKGKESAAYQEHFNGLCRLLHKRLDAAVADAYGWPSDLNEEQILGRLLALNLERAAEEGAERRSGGVKGQQRGKLEHELI